MVETDKQVTGLIIMHIDSNTCVATEAIQWFAGPKFEQLLEVVISEGIILRNVREGIERREDW